MKRNYALKRFESKNFQGIQKIHTKKSSNIIGLLEEQMTEVGTLSKNCRALL